MIQKISSREIFLKMVQNGSIRKVISIKAIFEDIFIFSPAVGRHLENFRKIFHNSEQSPSFLFYHHKECGHSYKTIYSAGQYLYKNQPGIPIQEAGREEER